jgi:hypothetical protein
MTTPEERTRALRWAGEFIRELQGPGAVALPDHIRKQIPAILRHYPSGVGIANQAKVESKEDFPWLLPEEGE